MKIKHPCHLNIYCVIGIILLGTWTQICKAGTITTNPPCDAYNNLQVEPGTNITFTVTDGSGDEQGDLVVTGSFPNAADYDPNHPVVMFDATPNPHVVTYTIVLATNADDLPNNSVITITHKDGTITCTGYGLLTIMSHRKAKTMVAANSSRLPFGHLFDNLTMLGLRVGLYRGSDPLNALLSALPTQTAPSIPNPAPGKTSPTSPTQNTGEVYIRTFQVNTTPGPPTAQSVYSNLPQNMLVRLTVMLPPPLGATGNPAPQPTPLHFYTLCRFKMTNPTPLTVSLSNPSGVASLLFYKVAQDTQVIDTTSGSSTMQLTCNTPTPPALSAWTYFAVSGETSSNNVNDTVLHIANTSNGTTTSLLDVHMTVFYFDKSTMTVASAGTTGAYTLDVTDGAYKPPNAPSNDFPIAVNMTATTTLMPAGVDLSKSRWKNMKLGISQAGLADNSHSTATFTLQAYSWNNNDNAPVAGSVTPTSFPNTYTLGGRLGANAADNEESSGLVVSTPNLTALMAGTSVSSTFTDAPCLDDLPAPLLNSSTEDNLYFPNPNSLQINLTVNNITVGSATYKLTSAQNNFNLVDWAVTYNPDDSEVIPLRECNWSVHITSGTGSQQATGSTADFAPTNSPLKGPPFCNTSGTYDTPQASSSTSPCP